MKIGIDISQTAYGGTGVANYLTKLVENLLEVDKHNDYVLFYSSLRRDVQHSKLYALKNNPQVRLVTKKLPPSVLELLWNKLHIYPIERVLGDIDIFITSDWTEPSVLRAKKITILYDLIVYKYP